MFLRSMLVFVLLVSPQVALSNYDPERIKQFIADNPELFLITGWHQNDNGNAWIAKTQQKWISISVGNDRSEVVSPYINAQQITVAKARCLELASSGLSIDTEADRKSIAKLIDDSSQHHKLKYLEKNGVRFEVTPKLVGAFVKLFCAVKPHSSGPT